MAALLGGAGTGLSSSPAERELPGPGQRQLHLCASEYLPRQRAGTGQRFRGGRLAFLTSKLSVFVVKAPQSNCALLPRASWSEKSAQPAPMSTAIN